MHHPGTLSSLFSCHIAHIWCLFHTSSYDFLLFYSIWFTLSNSFALFLYLLCHHLLHCLCDKIKWNWSNLTTKLIQFNSWLASQLHGLKQKCCACSCFSVCCIFDRLTDQHVECRQQAATREQNVQTHPEETALTLSSFIFIKADESFRDTALLAWPSSCMLLTACLANIKILKGNGFFSLVNDTQMNFHHTRITTSDLTEVTWSEELLYSSQSCVTIVCWFGNMPDLVMDSKTSVER